VEIENAHGTVCWNLTAEGAGGCGGPAQALVQKTENGRTYFSVKDTSFDDNQGSFEFYARIVE
jgi:hypothetical protein